MEPWYALPAIGTMQTWSAWSERAVNHHADLVAGHRGVSAT